MVESFNKSDLLQKIENYLESYFHTDQNLNTLLLTLKNKNILPFLKEIVRQDEK